MKTGIGLKRKYRTLVAYVNLVRFTARKYCIGFDYANLFLKRVDKVSIKVILRANGATIGSNCDIGTGITLHNCKEYSNLTIGDNCHIGKNCFFDLRGQVIMHDHVVVSMQTTFITHIDMNKSELSNIYPSTAKKIVLHKNCYVGVRSTILMGVELGENCMVAANSLMIKNGEPNTVYGGTPAKLIKKIRGKVEYEENSDGIHTCV